VALSAGLERFTGAVQLPLNGRLADWVIKLGKACHVQTATALPAASTLTLGKNASTPGEEIVTGVDQLPPNASVAP